MSIYVWTSEIKNVYVGTTPVKEIFVWTTKVRPAGYTPTSNTVAYYPLNWDVKDYSWNWYNLTETPVSYDTLQSWIKVAYYSWRRQSWVPSGVGMSLYSQSLPKTYNVWIKGVQYQSNTIQIFYLLWSWSYRVCDLYIQSNTVGASFWNGSWWNTATVSSSFALNTRYNVVVTYNNSTNIVSFYKNWTLIWSVNNGWYVNWSWYSWWTIWYSQSNTSSASYLSNVILENKAWTAQEVSDYYNLTKSNYWL